ncbi:MAG: hypothetical protein FGM36_15140 [Burkholderiaceae bacterium]|nr:hypothetical protein [Burkholderiaceae bacterium]
MADRRKLIELLMTQMESAQAKGVPYVREGRNIDVDRLPQVPNRIPGEGGISTVRSMGVTEDGNEVLIPTVVEGRLAPTAAKAEQEGMEHYRRTGKHLGKYATRAASDAAATLLHEREALRTGR